MNVDSFIDTNVFTYQLEGLDERKSATAARIIERGIVKGTACISFQVVQGCLNTVLRKARIPVGTEDAASYLQHVLAPPLPHTTERFRSAIVLASATASSSRPRSRPAAIASIPRICRTASAFGV